MIYDDDDDYSYGDGGNDAPLTESTTALIDPEITSASKSSDRSLPLYDDNQIKQHSPCDLDNTPIKMNLNNMTQKKKHLTVNIAVPNKGGMTILSRLSPLSSSSSHSLTKAKITVCTAESALEASVKHRTTAMAVDCHHQEEKFSSNIDSVMKHDRVLLESRSCETQQDAEFRIININTSMKSEGSSTDSTLVEDSPIESISSISASKIEAMNRFLKQTDVIIERFVADMESVHQQINYLHITDHGIDEDLLPYGYLEILAQQAALVRKMKDNAFSVFVLSPAENPAYAAATIGTHDVTKSACAASIIGTHDVTKSACAASIRGTH